MSDGEKERIKLTATFINGLAIAAASLGFMSPLIATLYGLVNAAPLGAVFLEGLSWLVAAVVLHAFAYWLLGDLDR